MRGAHGLMLAASLLVRPAGGTVGVDVSSAVDQDTWKCLMTPGGQGPIEFAIPRVYKSNGAVDTVGVQTVKDARAAGVKHVDGYIFPCVSCGNASGQVREAKAALDAAGAEYGMLWYDIERYKWNDDQAANQAFVKEMVDEGVALGVHAGIYAGYYSWVEIVGVAWDYPHSKGLPLWYAHYDGDKSFSDWPVGSQAYGGWTKPNIKQYYGDKTSCGASIDYDWYPDSAAWRRNATAH